MDTETLERIGQMVDTAENGLAATAIPLPPSVHVEGLKAVLAKLRDEAKAIYLASGGEDWWPETEGGSDG